MTPCDLDVLIIGAGLAGIGAACRLATKCPQKTFAVLEARANLGVKSALPGTADVGVHFTPK